MKKTGMAIVRAIVAGERDPARLAAHRDGRCRKSPDEIAKYLTGHWREDHLFNLASTLQIAIKARGDQASRLALWRFSGVDLTRIDGISAGTAQVVLTEVGASVASFLSMAPQEARQGPHAGHLQALRLAQAARADDSLVRR